jgi:hypothetical protein
MNIKNFQRTYLIGLNASKMNNYKKCLETHHGVSIENKYLQINIQFMPGNSIYAKKEFENKLMIIINSNRKINNLNGEYTSPEPFTENEIQNIENWLCVVTKENINKNIIIESYLKDKKRLEFILNETPSQSFNKSFSKYKKLNCFNLSEKSKSKLSNMDKIWKENISYFSSIISKVI